MSDESEIAKHFDQASPEAKARFVEKLAAIATGDAQTTPPTAYRHFHGPMPKGSGATYEVFHRVPGGGEGSGSAEGPTLEAAWEELGRDFAHDDPGWRAAARLVEALDLEPDRGGAPGKEQLTEALFTAAQQLGPAGFWEYPLDDVQGMMLTAFARLAARAEAYPDNASIHYWADYVGKAANGSLPVSIRRSGDTLSMAILFSEDAPRQLLEQGGSIEANPGFDLIGLVIDTRPHWFADVMQDLLGTAFRAEAFKLEGGRRLRPQLPQAMMLAATANAAPADPSVTHEGVSGVTLDNIEQVCRLEEAEF